MSRHARFTLPDVPLHVIQRGNDRQVAFFADEDYRRYLDVLHVAAGRSGCTIHAFCLMTNHVHLLLTPATERVIGDRPRLLLLPADGLLRSVRPTSDFRPCRATPASRCPR